MRCWFKNASFRIFEHTFYYFHWISKVDSVSCIQLDCFIHEIVVMMMMMMTQIHFYLESTNIHKYSDQNYLHWKILCSFHLSVLRFSSFFSNFVFGFRKLTKHTVFGKAKVRILRKAKKKEIRIRQRNDSFLITINKIAFVASKHYIALKSGYSLRRNMMTKSLLLFIVTWLISIGF